MCKVGNYSPWGRIDNIKILIEGVEDVSTPSHGGIKLNRKYNNKIPKEFRTAGGYYEEDAEWSIVCTYIPEAFSESARIIAKDTLKNWFPEVYESFYQVTLQAGESIRKDDLAFEAKHANDFVVVSACQIGLGMVKCFATRGGKRSGFSMGKEIKVETRIFLVPPDEYRTRNRHGFVIDLAKHRETFEQ